MERFARYGHDFPAGKLFVCIVGGPCQTFEAFSYGRDDPASVLMLATPTLVALGLHLTKPSRVRSRLCCLGIAWWFLWGFAISHVGV